MAERSKLRSRLGKGAIAFALAGAMAVGGVGTAFADNATYSRYGSSVAPVDSPSPNLITTYGVRAGSAGADFLGVTNSNFDFTQGSANQDDMFTGYTGYFGTSDEKRLDGLAIWGSSVNSDPNPFYANLLYCAITGSPQSYQATTWMKNGNNVSWGDSNYYETEDPITQEVTAHYPGMEYNEGPDIVFGANKYTSWLNDTSNGSNSGTMFYAYDQDSQLFPDFNPTFVSNDATNIWTQIHTMRQFAITANSLRSTVHYDEVTGEYIDGKELRYNDDAVANAEKYEDAIRGNMLYIASQIDAYNTALAAAQAEDPTVTTVDVGVERKTVAYLYAIDPDGVAYFFTPVADEMVSDISNAYPNGMDLGRGDKLPVVNENTGQFVTDDNGMYVIADNPNAATEGNPSTVYAGNNGTINLGYMGVLPFITDTFTGGTEVSGGIVMKVEDIWKSNPATMISTASGNELADVDVLIYNTTTVRGDALQGMSGGKNSSGISMNNNYGASYIQQWAQAHGFNGAYLAGDDFGTSTNQDIFANDVNTNTVTSSPILYCQRNYTADKNARAAWAFSAVYPELYGNNEDATYGFWVENIYHVNRASVPTVAGRLTGQAAASFNYSDTVAATVATNIANGYAWWSNTGQYSSDWAPYAYYNGSSRASWYSNNPNSIEGTDAIGIFEPIS